MVRIFSSQRKAVSPLNAALAIGLFVPAALAQKAPPDNGGGLPDLTSAVAENSKADASKTAADASKSSAAEAKTTAQSSKPASSAKPSETKKDSDSDQPTQTSESRAVITPTDSATGTNTVSVVKITGSATRTSGGGLTGLPKLPGQPQIVTQVVPDTANAPYMQQEKYPAGTVFIAVGAILGFLALCVIAWRILTVWALKRSVKRAQMGDTQDTKALLNFKPPDLGMYSDNRNSTLSLGVLGGKKNKNERPGTATGMGNTPGQSLFFSPTAGAGANGSGMLTQPGNRASAYLPSGYYAAGAAAPGGGSGLAHLGNGNRMSTREAISLSNLGPTVQGYQRAQSLGTTPPDSPNPSGLGAGLGHNAAMSTSTLDLSARTPNRAPSAYLDDLFDEAGAAPGNYPVNHPMHPNNQGGRF
jgi:hypothetical protein